MTGRLRKLGVTLHTVLSVGWLGAVAAFLALALAACSSDQVTSRAAFVAMGVIGRWVIVPLSLGALVSGVIQSLATKWGLHRYYWVLAKLILTVAAVVLLLLHQFTAVEQAARLARQASPDPDRALHGFGTQLAGDAALALVALFVITLLAVYKPWGLTPFVKRVGTVRVTQGARSWSLRLFAGAIVAFIAGFIALHLSGRSQHGHGH